MQSSFSFSVVPMTNSNHHNQAETSSNNGRNSTLKEVCPRKYLVHLSARAQTFGSKRHRETRPPRDATAFKRRKASDRLIEYTLCPEHSVHQSRKQLSKTSDASENDETLPTVWRSCGFDLGWLTEHRADTSPFSPWKTAITTTKQRRHSTMEGTAH